MKKTKGIDYILGLHLEENKTICDTKRYLGKIWKKRMGNEERIGEQRSVNGNDHDYYHVRQ